MNDEAGGGGGGRDGELHVKLNGWWWKIRGLRLIS